MIALEEAVMLLRKTGVGIGSGHTGSCGSDKGTGCAVWGSRGKVFRIVPIKLV